MHVSQQSLFFKFLVTLRLKMLLD